MKPPISVIIPTYNEEKNIDQLKWQLGYTCSLCGERMSKTFDLKPSKDDIVSVIIVLCEKCAKLYDEEELEKITKLELFMVKYMDDEGEQSAV